MRAVGCPDLVQGDCARFADDLSRAQPTVNFVARDGNGNDLPHTTVYVDGMLVATRIDGKPHDIDPGNHIVKFSNGGKDEVVTVVIGSGEKGRTVVGTFQAPEKARPMIPTPGSVTTSPRQVTNTTHAGGAKLAMIGGGLVTLAGAGLTFYGYSKIPSNCTLSSHECAAPPGDPVFGKAQSAVRDVDIGMVVGGVGLAALAGGLIWYVTSGHQTTETQVVVGPGSVGLQASF